jgi:hypothetical protein
VARYASGAVEKLLGTINGLNGDIQAKIFTAQDIINKLTFPMLVARYAPGAVGNLLATI